ncbi:MAG TPA: signal peptidase II [Deinococcales bacterium]|nr:signal peptidase II [Deinococcales bacterium]
MPVLALTAVWVILDQLLKSYVVANVPFNSLRAVVPGLLDLTHLENTGAAWSLFSGSALPLGILRGAVGIAIVYYLVTRSRSLPGMQRLALALIAGGAFGNSIDGLVRGHVVDMLVLHPLNWVYRPLFGSIYPPFNLADVGIVSGVILLLVSGLLPQRKAGGIRV